jgi:5'(3')-deoxyribonucleotidase
MKQCFLDMDGVLADFVGGVCKAHDRESPYSREESFGKFDMEGLWGISAQKFWRPTNEKGFWFNLEKTPEADRLVKLIEEIFGIENICILSSPSENMYCIPEKKEWIRKYFPQLSRNMLFGSCKQFLAKSNAVLIDDADKNVDKFKLFGGVGCLLPRPWNRLHSFEGDRVNFIWGLLS